MVFSSPVCLAPKQQCASIVMVIWARPQQYTHLKLHSTTRQEVALPILQQQLNAQEPADSSLSVHESCDQAASGSRLLLSLRTLGNPGLPFLAAPQWRRPWDHASSCGAGQRERRQRHFCCSSSSLWPLLQRALPARRRKEPKLRSRPSGRARHLFMRLPSSWWVAGLSPGAGATPCNSADEPSS
jgi:hypothetical protein